jgi:hypothetical protein
LGNFEEIDHLEELGRLIWEDDIKTDFRDLTQDVIHFMPFVTSLINVRVF